MTSECVQRPALVLALAWGLVVGGCTTQPKKASSPGLHSRRPLAARTSRSGDPAARDKPGNLSDACATRLHELSGLLLLYYAVNQKLPERLNELEPLADADVEFRTDCPTSGQPYVYSPTGIPAAGSERFLVLYDLVPAHGGLRWGVFIAPPKDKQPPATWVILMSETVFRNYVPLTR
jgi:hypothetical protein